MTSTNKPIDTLRTRGGLKATIWENTSTKGNKFNTVDITRTYKTEDGFRETRSFNQTELLAVARLAEKAYDRLNVLKSEDKS